MLVVGAASTASAADTYNLLSDIDGNQVGYMVHLDADPDRFRICDTQSDGYGVTGKLYIDQGVLAEMLTITDGGDAGCSAAVQKEITAPWDYVMKICWNGPGNICHSERFKE